MNDSPHILTVTLENYPQQVLETSHRVPVLLDFWAEWCGPCQMQMPLLLKLVEEYQGRFLLAKVDTDKQRELAQQHGIRSIPTIKMVRNGEVVEEIPGAQLEASLREILNRHVGRESDSGREAARQAYAAGDVDGAPSAAYWKVLFPVP